MVYGERGVLAADLLTADLVLYAHGPATMWDELAMFRGTTEGEIKRYALEKHEPLWAELCAFRDAVLGLPSPDRLAFRRSQCHHADRCPLACRGHSVSGGCGSSGHRPVGCPSEPVRLALKQRPQQEHSRQRRGPPRSNAQRTMRLSSTGTTAAMAKGSSDRPYRAGGFRSRR